MFSVACVTLQAYYRSAETLVAVLLFTANGGADFTQNTK